MKSLFYYFKSYTIGDVVKLSINKVNLWKL